MMTLLVWRPCPHHYRRLAFLMGSCHLSQLMVKPLPQIPWNRGWRSNREPMRSDRTQNRGWRSDCHPKRLDRMALRVIVITCLADLDRAPCGAHDFDRTPHGAHDSSCAKRGPGVFDSGSTTHSPGFLVLLAALLMSPSGYEGATDIASISAVTASEGCTDGSSGQPLSDDHEGEAGLPVIVTSENSSTMLDGDPQRANYAQAGPSDSNYACVKA
jgi:hypothetical protein